MKRILLFIFLNFSDLALAQGEFRLTDGNSLLRACNLIIREDEGNASTAPEQKYTLYMSGYLYGLIHGMLFGGYTGKRIVYDIPEGMPAIQVIRVIKKGLEDRPEKLGDGHEILIFNILREKFPSKESVK